jgi:enamine deaminase RidA (YjgF/YER057c/UK114 family)
MTVEQRIRELGLVLPPPAEPKGLYKPVVVVGDLAYTSGHLPIDATGKLIAGRAGADLDQQAAQEAARLAGLGILSSLQAAIGTLDRVRRVVKLVGLVNSTAEFTAQPAVINGCSQLLADVFGPDAGVGARSALGTNTLPLGAVVEIEAIFEISR